MNIHLYIWKENEEAMEKVDKPNQLINKLLAAYFKKYGTPKDEPSYEETDFS